MRWQALYCVAPYICVSLYGASTVHAHDYSQCESRLLTHRILQGSKSEGKEIKLIGALISGIRRVPQPLDKQRCAVWVELRFNALQNRTQLGRLVVVAFVYVQFSCHERNRHRLLNETRLLTSPFSPTHTHKQTRARTHIHTSLPCTDRDVTKRSYSGSMLGSSPANQPPSAYISVTSLGRAVSAAMW